MNISGFTTTARAKSSTSYVSSSATSTYQSTSVDMKSSSAAQQSNSSSLSFTSTSSSLVHISSVGSSTDNLLTDKTLLNTSPSSSPKPDKVQTTKDPFKTLSTKTDGVMTSLSTTNATNPAKISTINGVTIIAHFPLFHVTMTSIYKNRNLMRFSFWSICKTFVYRNNNT